MSRIAELAHAQLAAYNASDLEAFADCYHTEVQVLEGDVEMCRGRDALRERYRNLFENITFGGEATERIHVGPHCVDFERWWRLDPETGARQEGEVLVHYTERDGLIGWVRFLR